MLKQFNQAPPLTVNEHEEYIWMLQLQQPEQVIQQFQLWKLNYELSLLLLELSIKNTIKNYPILNSRFIFSEDGDLLKIIDPNFSNCIETVQLSADKVDQKISDLQNKVWNAEIDPPFKAFILKTEQDVLLVLSLHPILDETYKLHEIFEIIQNYYNKHLSNGQPLNPILLNRLKHTSIKPNNPIKHMPKLAHSEISEIILAEFRSILAEPDMTKEDDFFDFGGHSLLATRVIGYLQNKQGIELNFNDFFKSPTAVDLAKLALQKNVNFQQKKSQNIEQAPLTFTQDFLWEAYSTFNFSPIYNLPFAISFQDHIDENIFFQAFQDILIRHAGLRTLFKTEHTQVTQYAVPIAALDQYKWFWSSIESQDITLAQEAAYKFDLSFELPIRIRFFQDLHGQQTLSFLVHHMVIDEWSLNSIMADLKVAYFSRFNQQQPLWNTPANSIHELAISQQKKGLNIEHIQYWKTMLQGATYGLSLKNVAPFQVTNEPQIKWLELKFSSATYQTISYFSRQHQSSLFSVIYTAIVSALQKAGDLEDIVIGTSASGRTDPHFFDTVGYLTTMIAHRTQFKPEQSFTSLLKDTTRMLNESMAYADIPINHIQKALGVPDNTGLIFDVYIHIHSNNALNGTFKNPQGDVEYRQILPERHESMFGLHFEIMDNIINDEHQLSLIVTYQAHHYPTIIVEQITQTIQDILVELDCR